MERSAYQTATWVFVLSAAAYVLTLGWQRVTSTTPDAHFVHLANSYLHAQLDVVGGRPPTGNDWARFGGRWFVSFPPFPALLMLPVVAVWGTHVWDRLFWALFAGLGPAVVYLLLCRLNALGYASRTQRERLALTGLFGFGSVYFFTAVQGSVWFAAHVVASVLIGLYLLFALGAKRPLLAGICLGLCFMTRPTALLLGGVFLVEAVLTERRGLAERWALTGYRAFTDRLGLTDRRGLTDPPARHALASSQALLEGQALGVVRGLFVPAVMKKLAWFALPLLCIGVVSLWLNYARFDDPLSFGHEHLQIRWRGRIDEYGLFSYHFLGRNLAIFLTSLPWLLKSEPFVMVSRHGLALWVTTPGLLWLLWPRRVTPSLWGLGVFAGAVCLIDLCYQNSGWIQFGYRFSLDYLVVLFAMLAMGGRRFGPGFYGLAVLALVVNLFGALTFDRESKFYDRDRSQRVLVQPD